MNFFESKDARIYFDSFHEQLNNEVARMSDSEITSCDFQEWIDYLVSKYYIAPLVLFENNIEQTLSETKVKKSNLFRHDPYKSEYHEVDGVCITYKIPYDGDPYLFQIQPSNRILSRFSTNSFKYPRGDECGSFTLELSFTKLELQDKGDTMAEYVKKQFESKFKSYQKMVQYVNSEVDLFNKGLAEIAKNHLKKRKEKASSFVAISSMLQIPLTQNQNAPNTKPIPLKRITRRPATKPATKPAIPEYSISDNDYENINNIIAMCGTTMEKTARTYYMNNEEELRDHLLAALNTHYDVATGETFRKIGKTDIHIEFDKKAAFIGECKIWHGEKLFQDAIQQVINYSTWRDVKVSVIIFNKENQSFQDILSKISGWVIANTMSYTQPQANIWDCKYHRIDMNIDICLNISVFDLYVDKTQFQDNRFDINQ